MRLEYPNKKDSQEIIKEALISDKVKLDLDYNNLIFGENLSVLKSLVANEQLHGKIDLIYIDPPFATGNIFNIGLDRANTISNSLNDNIAYKDTVKGYNFIEFLRERLILLRYLLSDQGSIYLHIDYKIGHYVKIIMDEIFGISNFKNDITRIKCSPKNFKRKAYGNVKDMILFYTKTKSYIWNDLTEPYSNDDIDKLFKKKDGSRSYTTVPLHAPGETKNGKTSEAWRGILPPKGRHWRCSPEELDILEKDGLIEWSSSGNPRRKIYSDERKGKKIQDIWSFKDPHYPSYPTQKNSNMLDRIILNSSNESSIVLDCFCGGGTTILSADKFGRNWLGIDNSVESIKIIKSNLQSKYNYIDFFEIKDISTDR
ncbi:site-specific DNA-methyltransferase [Francisella philomiragia]|uniref:site-specific DNA-methyltransferase n=1 Tax=Francisella philomiragia TaxID=28110 RepID=UPI00224314EB|nr:site-specific DNA-methyltransferase [Francisella philomiragia]